MFGFWYLLSWWDGLKCFVILGFCFVCHPLEALYLWFILILVNGFFLFGLLLFAISALSGNVRGLSNSIKRHFVRDFISLHNLDIICLQ